MRPGANGQNRDRCAGVLSRQDDLARREKDRPDRAPTPGQTPLAPDVIYDSTFFVALEEFEKDRSIS